MSNQQVEKEYVTQLKTVIEKEPKSLRAAVAGAALEADNITTFFADLAQGGCASGMIGSLIYYTDTHAFFDKYYDDIEALRIELLENGTLTAWPDSDLKNHLAWLAFEETAYRLWDELGNH